MGPDAGFDSQIMGRAGSSSCVKDTLSVEIALSSGFEQPETRNVAINANEIAPAVLTNFALECSHTRSFI